MILLVDIYYDRGAGDRAGLLEVQGVGGRKEAQEVHWRKLSLGLAIADHTYYDKSLEERRAILNAPSINYLCKTIVLENKAYD